MSESIFEIDLMDISQLIEIDAEADPNDASTIVFKFGIDPDEFNQNSLEKVDKLREEQKKERR